MPNIETSSVKEQVEWFKAMRSDKVAPTHIELGNEFYLGMLNDPDSMRRWPDLKTSMAVMKTYTDVQYVLFAHPAARPV